MKISWIDPEAVDEIPEKAQKEAISLISKRSTVDKLDKELKEAKKTLKEKTLRLEDLVDAKKYGHDGLLRRIDEIIILREADKLAADKEGTKKKFQKQNLIY